MLNQSQGRKYHIGPTDDVFGVVRVVFWNGLRWDIFLKRMLPETYVSFAEVVVGVVVRNLLFLYSIAKLSLKWGNLQH